ncbi:hypothetical protein GLW04_02165 [Halobacillus litoralis]|uniref:Uncharacterized protein n=1 Tax=Halobacillus litoralis TaxID=45668 RepID=A0A845DYZ1_9BACI|nr:MULTISPECIES: hypothetical protein [Halobacillus]MYL18674.1 hypothetical protein [Halobacillus litoralis]MYL31580.1 hypothetical protein [Halobacillus halophilus]
MHYMERTNQVMLELMSGKRKSFGNFSYEEGRFTDGRNPLPEWEVRQFVLNYFLTLENLKINA